jgi:phytanoyl-CoA hydroxylase
MIDTEKKLQFEKDGFLILENFVSEKTSDRLRQRIEKLACEIKPEDELSVFITGPERQLKDKFFLESGNKIRFFLEENSTARIFNKCGHALHTLDPVFSEFSNSDNIRNAFSALGMQNPFIVQSMYIFKHAGLGGEVSWHQDATFLYTEPNTVIGLWFALDDASEKNGCLWAIPGGHKTGLKSRFLRVNETNLGFEHFDKSNFEIDKAVPLEVKKGTLVVLNSLLPHMSKPNLSNQSRHAYTLHAFDKNSCYPEDNWLRLH